MSEVTKPILLDETGQSIVTKLDAIKDAILNQLPAGDPVRITVVTPPTKTAYVVGDVFDPTGISVCAVFTNNAVLDITEQCVFSDEELSADDTSTTISWTWHPTSQVFTTTQSITVTTVKIVTWSSGTDAEVKDMLDAYYAGDIDIYDYWTVGDKRTVHLDAMAATGVNESHVAQDVVLTLIHKGNMKYYNPQNWQELGTCAFVFALDEPLAESGYIDSSSQEGFSGTARYTWLNSIFKNAIPSSLRDIFKFTKYIFNDDESFGMNYFGLLAEKEVFGDDAVYSPSDEQSALIQFDYYKTSANITKINGSWFRSAYFANPGVSTAYWCQNGLSVPSYDDINDDKKIVPIGII